MGSLFPFFLPQFSLKLKKIFLSHWNSSQTEEGLTDPIGQSDQLQGSSKDVAEKQGPEPKNKDKRSKIQTVKLGNNSSGIQGLSPTMVFEP